MTILCKTSCLSTSFKHMHHGQRAFLNGKAYLLIHNICYEDDPMNVGDIMNQIGPHRISHEMPVENVIGPFIQITYLKPF